MIANLFRSVRSAVQRHSRWAWAVVFLWCACCIAVACSHWWIEPGLPLEEDYRVRMETTVWVCGSFVMMAALIVFVGMCLDGDGHPDGEKLEGETDAD